MRWTQFGIPRRSGRPPAQRVWVSGSLPSVPGMECRVKQTQRQQPELATDPHRQGAPAYLRPHRARCRRPEGGNVSQSSEKGARTYGFCEVPNVCASRPGQHPRSKVSNQEGAWGTQFGASRMRASKRPRLPWKQTGITAWLYAGTVFPAPGRKAMLGGPTGAVSVNKDLSHSQWE